MTQVVPYNHTIPWTNWFMYSVSELRLPTVAAIPTLCERLMVIYYWVILLHTVRCRYNAVNFITNIHKRHPMARPLGRGMGCLLWIQHLIDIMSQFLQLLMQNLAILDRVITALNCIMRNWPWSTLFESMDWYQAITWLSIMSSYVIHLRVTIT